MNIKRCANGHFYDGDTVSECPYCSSGAKAVTDEPTPLYPVKSEVNPSDIMCAKPVNAESQEKEAPYLFISYSHADSAEVLGVIDYLKSNHFNVWYDEGIMTGIEWADEISRRIKRCEQFICFISRNSVNSKSVKDEINIAWKYNINILVVYLEKVELDGGLEMQLDRKQAIMKYALNEQEFRRKLCSAISQDVVIIKKDANPKDIKVNDKYEVISMLSVGGTGTTYLAKHKATGAQVVIKHGAFDDTVSGQRIKRSFEKERDTLSRNISPFLPHLYDYYCDDENVYLVESYIEGTAISSVAGLSLKEKIELFIKAAKVIRELHNNGIYHCDIKPEHILVNRHGCFLIDLGASEDANVAYSDDVKMGTVTYAAPEQFVSYNGENDIFGSYQKSNVLQTEEGLFTVTPPLATEKRIDERTDIYAFGRVMVKTISNSKTKVCPTEAFPVTTVLFADVTRTIGEFSDNPLLQAIIEKMVREEKRSRYKNMDEVIKVLEDFLKIYN